MIAVLVACLAILLLEVSYRLLLVALCWILPIWAGLAAAYFVVSLHLSDPLASLWAFLVVAIGGRLLFGRARNWLLSRSN